MASKMPGDGTAGFKLPEYSLSDALKGPTLVVPPKRNWTSNGTYGRVKACYVDGVDPPGQQYLSQGPSQEELARQAEAKEHLENVFAMEEDPLWFVAEASRAFGASEHQVSVLHKLTTSVGEGMGEVAKKSME